MIWDTSPQASDRSGIDLDNFLFGVYDVLVNFWFRIPLRTRLGIIGIVFLIAVIVLLLSWYRNPGYVPFRENWVLRFGPLIFLIWLALPELEKIPWRHWLVMLAVILVCAIRPGAWFIGVPVICYVLFAGHRK